MGYFIDAEGNYPRHAGDVQAIQPDWVEGVDALPDGWKEVTAGVFPAITETQTVEELAPALVKGILTRQFAVRDLTVDELARAEAARQEFMGLGG